MDIAPEMLTTFNDYPDLHKKVMTFCDESWHWNQNPIIPMEASNWAKTVKKRYTRSNVNVLLTVIFNFKGVVHHEFLPQGRTVNGEYHYLKVMRRLPEEICQKRTQLWKKLSWILHHDNTPAHTMMPVREFLAKIETVNMPQPPYSPDLAAQLFPLPKTEDLEVAVA